MNARSDEGEDGRLVVAIGGARSVAVEAAPYMHRDRCCKGLERERSSLETLGALRTTAAATVSPLRALP